MKVRRNKNLKKSKPSLNPLRRDPTRTASIRRRFLASIRRAFRKLRAAVVQLIAREDALGLKPRQPFTANERWRYFTAPDKIRQFRIWLRQQFGEVTGRSEEELWKRYVEEGFRQGAGRAFDDANRRARAAAADRPDFYAGTREEFLRSSFAQPVAVEKVQLLAGRAFDELEGVTTGMATRMTRVLADGLVRGESPLTIARDLADQIDIGRGRAETIARTEISRAHAEGQLLALDEMGVQELGVQVEWSVSGLGVTEKGNPSPCDECAEMAGRTYTIEEASGLIPFHPG